MLQQFLHFLAKNSNKPRNALCSISPIFSPSTSNSSTGSVFGMISSNLSLERDGLYNTGDYMNKELPTSTPIDYKRVLRQVQSAHCVYIKICRHNVLTTLTTSKGKPLAWATCGLLGFKNARKRTEFASTAVGRLIGTKALAKKIDSVHLKIQGLNMKRRVATVKGIIESGVHIVAITDNTPLPFSKGYKPRAVRSL